MPRTVDSILSVLLGELRAHGQNPTITADHQESVVVVEVLVNSPLVERGKESALNNERFFFI